MFFQVSLIRWAVAALKPLLKTPYYGAQVRLYVFFAFKM